MAKIINFKILEKEIAAEKKAGKSIVLVGGCFDILHLGHIKFLEEAKKNGNSLFILLESDETVRRLKGKNRPYFSQKDRAEVLSSIKYVDYVILIPPLKRDEEYEDLTLKISPNIIAVTANDPLLSKKQKQVRMVKGEIKVIPYVKTFSSSRLAQLLGIE